MLLQSQDGATWQPVVFSLYSLNETELSHAQIEKEILALVYTCEKFPLDYALSLNTVRSTYLKDKENYGFPNFHDHLKTDFCQLKRILIML